VALDVVCEVVAELVPAGLLEAAGEEKTQPDRLRAAAKKLRLKTERCLCILMPLCNFNYRKVEADFT
jgi:hypothetical protein